MVQDNITIKRIKKLHPIVREEVIKAYLHVNNKILGPGVRLRFTSTFRTYKEQDQLYAKGRTEVGPKVTNAEGGQSYHNFGLAFDIVLLIDKDRNGTFEAVSWSITEDHDKDHLADWIEVANYFKSIGWEWGGDWSKFKDYPHFQKTFGYTWKDLNEKITGGNFLTELTKGKAYEYPCI